MSPLYCVGTGPIVDDGFGYLLQSNEKITATDNNHQPYLYTIPPYYVTKGSNSHVSIECLAPTNATNTNMESNQQPDLTFMQLLYYIANGPMVHDGIRIQIPNLYTMPWYYFSTGPPVEDAFVSHPASNTSTTLTIDNQQACLDTMTKWSVANGSIAENILWPLPPTKQSKSTTDNTLPPFFHTMLPPYYFQMGHKQQDVAATWSQTNPTITTTDNSQKNYLYTMPSYFVKTRPSINDDASCLPLTNPMNTMTENNDQHYLGTMPPQYCAATQPLNDRISQTQTPKTPTTDLYSNKMNPSLLSPDVLHMGTAWSPIHNLPTEQMNLTCLHKCAHQW